MQSVELGSGAFFNHQNLFMQIHKDKMPPREFSPLEALKSCEITAESITMSCHKRDT